MLTKKRRLEQEQKQREEMLKELYRIKIISEYTDLCKILEADLTSKEKIRAFILYELDHGGLETDHSFENCEELQMGVDGLKNYKFSVLYQIISAGMREQELRVQNPLAAAKMITSMMAGWALVKKDINFDCYPKDESKPGMSEDEALAQTVFNLIEAKDSADDLWDFQLAWELPGIAPFRERRMLAAPGGQNEDE